MIYQAPEMRFRGINPNKQERVKREPKAANPKGVTPTQKPEPIRKSHALFDFIKEQYKVPSDVVLADMLGTTPPAISRIRTGTTKINATLVLAIYDATTMSVEKIRELLDES